MNVTKNRNGTLIQSVGIAGAALMVLSDLLLLYSPIPRSQYDFLEVAKGISELRILTGDYLGLLGVPLVLVGLYGIYIELRPAGRWHSLPPILLLAYSYLLGAVFHHAVGMTMSSARQEVLGGVAEVITSDLVQNFLEPLGIVFLIVASLGSAWLFISLILGPTSYPRWMAFLSPLVLVLVLRVGALIGPPAIVGALIPAGPNLAMLVFFISSAIWLRPRGATDLSDGTI